MACLVLWLTCMFTSDIKEDSQAANAYMLENFEVITLVCFATIKSIFKKIQVTERPSNLLRTSELVSARPEL